MPPPPASEPPSAASVAAEGPKRRRTLPYQDRCEATETTGQTEADAAEEPTAGRPSDTRLTRPCMGDDGRYAIIYATARQS